MRRTWVVPIANIQYLALGASPLQRVSRLATLTFKIPKAHARAIDLDRGRAAERYEQIRAVLVPGPAA